MACGGANTLINPRTVTTLVKLCINLNWKRTLTKYIKKLIKFDEFLLSYNLKINFFSIINCDVTSALFNSTSSEA